MDGCSRDETLHRPAVDTTLDTEMKYIHTLRYHHSRWTLSPDGNFPFLHLGLHDSTGVLAWPWDTDARVPSSRRQLVGRGVDASSRAMGTMSASFLATSSRARFCTLLVLYFGLLVPVLSFGIRQVIVQIDRLSRLRLRSPARFKIARLSHNAAFHSPSFLGPRLCCLVPGQRQRHRGHNAHGLQFPPRDGR